jgi:hypothetical protein
MYSRRINFYMFGNRYNNANWSRKEIEKAIAVLSIKREEIPKYFFEILE